MRGEDDVVESAEFRLPAVELVIEGSTVGARFGGKHVEGGTGEMTRLDGLDESGNVDDFAASVVDEVRPLLHLGELDGGYHVRRFWQLGDVKGDEVGFGEEVMEGVDLTGGTEGHEVDNVIEEDAHAEGFSEDGELGADVTVADDAQCFTTDLPAAPGLLVPETLAHLPATLEVLSSESDDLGNDELSDGARVREGGVEDGNASFGGGGEVDLVCADAEAADDKQLNSSRHVNSSNAFHGDR